ncbi:Rap1 Myb domain-containing protein [Aspergillus spinulosporus]
MSHNEQHGGIVKLFETEADVQIVDHRRKNLPANVYSYQFIEKSIQKGRLENLEAYKAGPSTARPVGATNIPAKGQRSAYTTEEDQLIYDYMQPHERDPLSSVMGNKLYQLFAANHPGHTWQSWRDRYLKRLRDRPRPGRMLESNNATDVREEDRKSHLIRAPTATSRPAVRATQRDESSVQPRERKRKRSPEPSMSGSRTSNGTSSAQQGTTNRHSTTSAPQVVTISPVSASHQEKSPQDDTLPSPKKVKTTETRISETTIPQGNGPTEEALGRDPADETSTSIDSVFLELPFLPSSPVAEEAPEQDIDSWIDSQIRAGKGSEDQVIEALQCTSMDPELAEKVLESLTAGKGIPTNMRGVWTAQDDRDLEAQNTRDIQRVIEKHGDLLNYRWDYLNMTRAAAR